MELRINNGKDQVAERLFILKALTGKLTLYKSSPVAVTLDNDVDLDVIAQMTVGFGETDLRRVCDVALNGARRRAYMAVCEEESVQPGWTLSELLKVSQAELVAAVEDVVLSRDLEMATRDVLQDLFDQRFVDLVLKLLSEEGKHT